MPTIKIEHDSKKTPEETFKLVQNYLNKSTSLRKLDSDIQCQFDEKNFTGEVKGSKFTGDVKVHAGSPSKVVININIGFLLSPFKGAIHDKLKSKMEELLG